MTARRRWESLRPLGLSHLAVAGHPHPQTPGRDRYTSPKRKRGTRESPRGESLACGSGKCPLPNSLLLLSPERRMLARDLVQLAALVAEKGPVLVAGPAEIEPRRVAQYWSASKCRQDRWTRALKTFKFVAAKSGPPDATAGLPQTLIEILTGETLTRAWTAVLCAYDRRRRVQEAEPVARGIFSGHLEARNRALQLLLDGRGLTLSQAVQIDRLRRRSERWSDLLVARLIELADVSELAPDPVRARRLALESREGTALTGPAAFWPAVVASVTAASREIPAEPTPNPDLNAEIAASIVGCFPPGMFDGAGVMTSLRFARMSAAADDTQGMIESLLSDERADESPGRPGPRHGAEKFKRRF